MPTKTTDNTICPHLHEDQAKSLCGINHEGIYLPMPEYLLFYCNSNNFINCFKFFQYTERIRKDTSITEQFTSETRRFHPRIICKWPLSISTKETFAHSSAVSNLQATTIDLSKGGIRFSCTSKLATDQKIEFAFSPDFPLPSWFGSGTIRYCQPQYDSNKFNAGLQFIDENSGQVIAHCLNFSKIT